MSLRQITWGVTRAGCGRPCMIMDILEADCNVIDQLLVPDHEVGQVWETVIMLGFYTS